MKGIIVVHGTSRDITSVKETTVQIAKAAKAAGHLVVQIGGPGSTERAMLRSFKRNLGNTEVTPIDEIGFPMDYVWDVLAGTAGAGVDDIVEEIVTEAMRMIDAGVTSVELVGFSRGAVSLALALERIGEKAGATYRAPVPINVCLMDPVPGPYLVPQHVEIPSFVSRLLLLTSKHEGRPGFLHMGLTVSPEVQFTADLVMGVHGDIGGSTGSDMTVLIRSEVAEFVGLAPLRISPEERMERTLDIIAGPSRYTRPGLRQMMRRREIGWSGHEDQPGVIELPSARALGDLEAWTPPELDETPVQPVARRAVMRDPIMRDPGGEVAVPPIMRLIVPRRPVRDVHTNRVVYQPPAVIHPGRTLLGKFAKGLKMAARRKFFL